MNPHIIYLPPKEFAEKIGVSTSTLRRWERDGIIAPLRTPTGHRRYSLDMVEDYLKEKEAQMMKKMEHGKQCVIYTQHENSTGDIRNENEDGRYSRLNGALLIHTVVQKWHNIGLVMVSFSFIFVLIALTNWLRYSWKISELSTVNSIAKRSDSPGLNLSEVLAATTSKRNTALVFNIPVEFRKDINARGITIDANEGKIFASNLLYGIEAGEGVVVSDGQTPIVSFNGVQSLNGNRGYIELTAGEGISLNELEITNNDRGSSQSIFKNINSNGTIVKATENDDTLKLTSGSGISLSTSGKEITISANANSSYSYWKTKVNGVIYDNIENDESLEFVSGADINVSRSDTNQLTFGLQPTIDTVSTINLPTGGAINGSDSVINFSNFDVNASGGVTIAAGQTYTVGSIGLNSTAPTPGASLVGVNIGALNNSNPLSSDLQTVLEALDSAMGSGSSKWSIGSGVLYPTNPTVNNFAVGGSAINTAPLGVDVTNNIVYVNGAAQLSSTIYAPNIGTGTDNSVLVLNSAGYFVTDEIDSRVWGSGLLDSSTGFIQGGNSFTTLATLGTNDAYGLAFETNNTERMRIDFSGNVGIGTTAPNAVLAVKGSSTDGVEGAQLLTDTEDRWFTADLDHWNGTNWTIGSGVATHTAGDYDFIHTLTPTAGRTYLITAKVVTTTAGAITAKIGSVAGDTSVGGTVGTIDTGYWVITASNTQSLRFDVSSSWEGYIDNVTVNELTNSSPVLSLLNSNGTSGISFMAGGSGGQNTYIGTRSGYYSLATQNTALGYEALRYNVYGYGNTATGFYALKNNADGGYNSAFGYAALASNINGHENVAVGDEAMWGNLNGYANVGLGFRALVGNKTGSSNVAIGPFAGQYQGAGYTQLSSPENSIYIGASSRGYSDDDNNSIVIGYDARGIGANTVVLGNDSIVTTALKGNVGIGTTVPGYALDVAGTGRFTGALTLVTVASVADNNAVLTTDSGVIKYVDSSAWDKNASNDVTTFLGLSDTPSAYTSQGLKVVRVNLGETGLEFADLALDSTYFSQNGNSFTGLATLGTNDAYGLAFETGGTEWMRILTDGKVGIGTSSPSEKLDVTGSLILGTSGNAYFKIRDFDDGSITPTSIIGRDGNMQIFSGGLVVGNYANNVVGTMGAGSAIFSGNVAIGTTAPTQALDIAGSARITGALYDSSNSAGSSTNILTSTGSGTAWTDMSTVLLPSGTEGQTLYNNAGTWTTNSGLFYDDVNARVGIGTTGPSNILHVLSNSSVTDSIVTVARFTTNTTGTPANGLGVGINFGIESDLTEDKYAGSIQYSYAENTDSGGVKTDFQIYASNGGGPNDRQLFSSANSSNVAFGSGTLNNGSYSGTSNTAIGMNSGNAITSGSGNTLLGYQSAYSSTTGANNVIIGSRAGFSSTGSSNIFLGYNAGYNETGSNKLYIENSNSTSPLIYGDFVDDYVQINNSLRTNTIRAKDASGLNIHDDGGNGVFVQDGGNVGIGTTSPGSALDLVGDMNISGGLSVNVNKTSTTGIAINVQESGLAKGINVINTGAGSAMSGLYNTLEVTAASSYKTGVHNTTTNDGVSGSSSFLIGTWNELTGTGSNSTYYGTYNTLFPKNADLVSQNLYGTYTSLKTHAGASDVGYGEYIIDDNASTGGTQYGVYLNLDDADVTRYGIYETGGATNYFAGNVGIGTTSPADTLNIYGGPVGIGMDHPYVSGLGVNGRSHFEGSFGAPILEVYNNNTDGTTTPQAGAIYAQGGGATGQFGFSGNSYGIYALAGNPGGIDTNAYTYGIYAKAGTIDNSYDNTYAIYADGGSGTTGNRYSGYFVNGQVYMQSNLGIGTTAASQALHVVGSARITGALYDSANSAGSNTDILTSTGTGTAWTSVSSAFDTTYFKQNGNSFTGLATLGTNDAYGLAFETNNAEQMRVDPAGNVGIGTTSPTSRLEIKDSSSITQLSSEMITNADDRTFASDLGHWSGSNWTIGTGVATHTAGANTYSLANTYLSESPSAGQMYSVTVSVTTITTGTLTASFGGANAFTAGQVTGSTWSTYNVTASNTNPLTITPNATWTGTIDNVSVKRLTSIGSVALQLTPSNGSSNPIEFRTGTSSGNSIFIGAEAGKYAISDYAGESIGIGYRALLNAQDYANIAIGTGALSMGTQIAFNTAIGQTPLSNLNYGYHNQVMGYQNMAGVKEAHNNVSIGSMIGSDQLNNVYNIQNNVFLGYRAAYALTSNASNNVVIGYEAGSNIGGNSGNIFLGYQAGYSETGSNKLYVDNSNTTSPLIWGDFNTNVVNFNGNVGIGTTSPLSRLNILQYQNQGLLITGQNTSLSINSDYSGYQTNTISSLGSGLVIKTNSTDGVTLDPTGGVSGRLRINNSSSSTTVDINANSDSYFNGGNVGIGTTAPSSALSFGSSSDITRGTTDGTDNGLLTLSGGGAYSTTRGGAIAAYGNEHASFPGYVTMFGGNIAGGGALNFYTQDLERMRITYGGNVGIGTTSPTRKLEVNGSFWLTGQLYDSTEAPGLSGYYLQSTGSGTTWTDMSTVLLPSGTEGQTLYNNAGTWTAHNGTFWDDVNSRLGIGTTAPDQKLDVAGDAEIANYLYFGNSTSEYLRWDSSNFLLSDDLLPNANDALDLGSDTARWRDLYLGGETLHIGSSTTDEGTISYNTTSNIFNFGTDSTTNGDIAFFTNNLFLDKSTGSVGIGTTSPGATLQVGADATPTVSDGFEDGTLDPFTTSGDANWAVQGVTVRTGSYAAKAGTVTNSQSTTLTLSSSLTNPAVISFYYKVSSEENYDVLTFSIDGEPQKTWSGTIDWTKYSVHVPSGSYTFTWRYSKDSGITSGSDTAWIDDITVIEYGALANFISPVLIGDVIADSGALLSVGGNINTNGMYQIQGQNILNVSGGGLCLGIGTCEADNMSSNSTFIGYRAGTNTTLGFDNTFIGSSSGTNNTIGSANTAIGHGSLRSNTEGDYNTALGKMSLSSNTTGDNNIAIGRSALFYNTSGSSNVALGRLAGVYHANGSTALTDPENSIYIGYNTRGYSNDDSNSIVIGYEAIGLGANTVVLGNDSITTTALKGNVGIGTTSPNQKLDIVGNVNVNTNGTDALFSTYKGADSIGSNIFIGNGGQSSVGAVGETYKGSYNTSLGISALTSNTTGYQNTAVGTFTLNANTSAILNTAVGYSVLTNANGTANTGTGAFTLYSNTSGYFNSGFGYASLYNNIGGYHNSAHGSYSLEQITSGYINTAIGYNAGRYIADGTSPNQTSNTSLYLGADTKALADGGANEIVLGYNTTGFGSYSAAYGNSNIAKHIFQSGNVGIGTTSPTAKLHALGPNGATAQNALEALRIIGGKGGAESAPFEGDYGTGGGIYMAAGDGGDGDDMAGSGGDVNILSGQGGTGYSGGGGGNISLTAGSGYTGGSVYISGGGASYMFGGGIVGLQRFNGGSVMVGSGLLSPFEHTFAIHGSTLGASTLNPLAVEMTSTIPTRGIKIHNYDTTVNSQSGLTFLLRSTGSSYGDSGSISTGKENLWGVASTWNSYVSFHTSQAGSLAEKLRITSGGNVGIGTTAPDNKLHMYKSDTGVMETANASMLILEQGSTGDTSIQFELAGGQLFSMGIDNSDNDNFKLLDGSTTVMDIDGTLNVVDFAKTIGLNGAPAATNYGINYSITNDPTGSMRGLNNSITGGAGANSGYGVYNTMSSAYSDMNGIVNVISSTANYSYAAGMWSTVTSGGDGNIGYGVHSRVQGSNDNLAQTLYGDQIELVTYGGTATDIAYGLHITDVSTTSTGGKQYGLYIDVDDADVTNHSVYVESGSGHSYFGSNVGIGTTSPGAALEVNGDIKLTSSLQKIFWNSSYDFIADGGIYSSGGQFIRIDSDSTTSDSYLDIQKDSGTSLLFVSESGNVGIGTTAPSYALDVKSTGTDIARFTGTNSTGCTLSDGGVIACSSDQNLKKNIVETELGLETVMNLRPVEFNWNSQSEGDKKYLGFIAQEVEQIAPNLVTIDSNGYRQLNSIGLIPVVAKAIQEQQGILEQTSVSVQTTADKQDEITQRQNAVEQVLNELTTKVNSWDNLFISIQSIIQTIQDTFVAIQTQLGLVQTDVAMTKQDIASMSASLNKITMDMANWRDGIASESGVLGASNSATLEHGATVSALLVKDNLTVEGKTTTFDLTVLNKLMTGVIELGAGIDGDEINSSTGIRFQTLAQGPVDFMNGKVIINVDGSVEMTHLKLNTTDPNTTTIGTATIGTGYASMTIDSTIITSESMVFITPTSYIDKPIFVNAKIPGVGFVVTIAEPATKDIDFQWMIVN